jgi:hypothetical protein
MGAAGTVRAGTCVAAGGVPAGRRNASATRVTLVATRVKLVHPPDGSSRTRVELVAKRRPGASRSDDVVHRRVTGDACLRPFSARAHPVESLCDALDVGHRPVESHQVHRH